MKPELVAAWLARPLESRRAVVEELISMAVGWSDQSADDLSREDGATLQAVIDMLEDVDEASFMGS